MDGRQRVIAFVYLAGGILLMIGLTATVTLFASTSQTMVSETFKQLNGSEDGIFMVGHIYGIDIPSRTIQVLWIIGGCGSLRLQSAQTYDAGRSQCGPPNIPLAIYFNGNLMTSIDVNNFYTTDPATNTTTIITSGLMTHLLDIENAQLAGPHARVFNQQIWYPFDTYHGGGTFFALNSNDNSSLPMSRVVFADPVNNFAPTSTETPMRSMFNGTAVDSRASRLELRRTINSQLYTMILFVVNWLLTLLVAYIPVLAQLGEKFGEGIVVLPLTMILTLPTIRGLYVENPPFGIFLGLVLQMIIVSLCSVIILLPSMGLTLSAKRLSQQEYIHLKGDRKYNTTLSQEDWIIG